MIEQDFIKIDLSETCKTNIDIFHSIAIAKKYQKNINKKVTELIGVAIAEARVDELRNSPDFVSFEGGFKTDIEDEVELRYTVLVENTQSMADFGRELFVKNSAYFIKECVLENSTKSIKQSVIDSEKIESDNIDKLMSKVSVN